jgi:enoyl-CoA hydratase
LSAKDVNADEALRIGLVDRVVPRDSLDATARELAERVLGFSATALRECKALLAHASTLDADGYERAFGEAQQRCLDARE